MSGTSTTAPDATSLAVAGKGTIFSIQSSAVGVAPIEYTQVAELKEIGFSGSKNDTVDVTNFDSAGRAKEFITTLLESGDVKLSGNYIPTDAGQALFKAAFASGAKLSFKMVLPLFPGQTNTGETWTFLAIVEENDLNIKYDSALTFSASIKISGVITYVAGS